MRVSRSPMTSLHQLTRAVAALTLASVSAAAIAQAAPGTTPMQAAAPSPEALEIQRPHQERPEHAGSEADRRRPGEEPEGSGDALSPRRDAVDAGPQGRGAAGVPEAGRGSSRDAFAPYNNLAVLYGSQGDYDKARAALVAAIRTNPQYATAYQNLGDVYAQLASQAYSKALQLDKSDTTVPPKLVLLRELIANPGQAAARAHHGRRSGGHATAPAPTPRQASTQVAARHAAPKPAPVPPPAPAPAPVAVKPAPTPAPAPVAVKPAPTPAPAFPLRPLRPAVASHMRHRRGRGCRPRLGLGMEPIVT